MPKCLVVHPNNQMEKNPFFLEWIMSFWREIASALGVVVATIIIRATISGKRMAKSFFRRNSLQARIRKDLQIVERLVEVRMEYGADRVYVFQISNGTYYRNNGSQYVLVCTHESDKAGISTIGPGKFEMLVSTMPLFFNRLLEADCIVCATEDIPDPIMKAHLVRHGVETIVAVPFRNKQGDLEGYVGMDFLSRETAEKLMEGDGLDSDHCTKLLSMVEVIGTELRA